MTAPPGFPRWLLVSGGTELVGTVLGDYVDRGFTARLLWGDVMGSQRGILSQFAAAFQFPWYFGFNWHAFDETFGELGDDRDINDIAIVIANASRVGTDDGQSLDDLVRSLGYAGEDWISSGAVQRFDVVVQIEPSSGDVARWVAAGAALASFEGGASSAG